MNNLKRELCMLAMTLALIVTLFLLDPDPDKGGTIIALHKLAMIALFAHAAHGLRKLLHPYDDLQDLAIMARQGSTGAGLVRVAQAIIFAALMFGIVSFAKAAVPDRAAQYLPTLVAEQKAHMPEHQQPWYFGGLIEHESCITLTHPRCWAPTSRLKTAREEGAGFGQITRAYRADGSLRFDALAELRAQHPALADWSWSNVYQRPDLQLRAVVLKVRGDSQALRAVADPSERMAMADAAYNGGMGGVQNDRRACAIKAGCDPQKWFGHVEASCTKSRAALYGQRSACDINRHHVADVLRVRMPKYRAAWV